MFLLVTCQHSGVKRQQSKISQLIHFLNTYLLIVAEQRVSYSATNTCSSQVRHGQVIIETSVVRLKPFHT